eukprot:m.84177 g.84177  ORF g.84177 m.84177 type:complete len:310 (-) comp15007_c0_seq1:325-1254(-)
MRWLVLLHDRGGRALRGHRLDDLDVCAEPHVDVGCHLREDLCAGPAPRAHLGRAADRDEVVEHWHNDAWHRVQIHGQERRAVDWDDDVLPEVCGDAEEAAEEAEGDDVEGVEEGEGVEAGRGERGPGQPGVADADDVDEEAPAEKVEAQADAQIARVLVAARHGAVGKDHALAGVVQKEGQPHHLRLDAKLLEQLVVVVKVLVGPRQDAEARHHSRICGPHRRLGIASKHLALFVERDVAAGAGKAVRSRTAGNAATDDSDPLGLDRLAPEIPDDDDREDGQGEVAKQRDQRGRHEERHDPGQQPPHGC